MESYLERGKPTRLTAVQLSTIIGGPLAGWREISTAPRDGQHFLACDASRSFGWMNGKALPPVQTVVHWFEHGDDSGFYTSVNETEPQRTFPATHWRPLDAPNPAENNASIPSNASAGNSATDELFVLGEEVEEQSRSSASLPSVVASDARTETPSPAGKPRPSNCANAMRCGWHHLQTEPPTDIWVCGEMGCPNGVVPSPAGKGEL